MLHLEVELVALSAVVFLRLVLQVAERAVAVVGRLMRIRIEAGIGLFRNLIAVVALEARVFVRRFRILHVRAVAAGAFKAAGDMAVGAEVGGRGGRAEDEAGARENEGEAIHVCGVSEGWSEPFA